MENKNTEDCEKKQKNFKPSDLLKNELFRFLIVGGIAVALDLVSYSALQRFVGINAVWSKRVSFGVGSIWAFFANKYFTFAAREIRASDPVLFAIVYVAGWLINSFTHELLLGWFGLKSFAFIIATSVSTCSNFVGQKYVVFRRKALDAKR